MVSILSYCIEFSGTNFQQSWVGLVGSCINESIYLVYADARILQCTLIQSFYWCFHFNFLLPIGLNHILLSRVGGESLQCNQCSPFSNHPLYFSHRLCLGLISSFLLFDGKRNKSSKDHLHSSSPFLAHRLYDSRTEKGRFHLSLLSLFWNSFTLNISALSL